jgi:non-specific serine/threonine protein kinase/serine/threonine-protein kinase
MTSRLTRWRRRVLDGLLDEFLDLDRVERAGRLERMSARHPRVAAWLCRLLEAADCESDLFETSLARASRRTLDRIELDSDRLEPGAWLGPWQVDSMAGHGGMGVVYRGHRADGRFERDVAIKLMRRSHPDFAERLAQETRLLARLDHPSVARILDGGQTGDGRYYMVMDWIGGDNLDQVLKQRDPAPGEVLDVFEQVGEAVAHAHQRLVVHGDIKPANIRIQPDGRAVLLDFGIARVIEGDDPDPDAPRAFTPAFAAPEQRAGQPATTQTDVWSLGALLAWLARGGVVEAPDRLDPGQVRLERAADLVAIVRKATATDAADRYSGVAALLADMHRLRSQRPVSARRAGALRLLGLWARRHRTAAALGLLAIASLAAGIATQTWQARIVAAERDVARFEAERSALLREQFTLLFRDAAAAAEPGEELSARELLDSSALLAEDTLGSDPAAMAAVKAMLGEIYLAMDDYAAAEPLLRSFVASDTDAVSPLLRAMGYGDLAQVELRKGNSEQALQLVDAAIEILERRPGDYAERRADLMGIRGQTLRGLGRWDEAISTLREALAIAQAHRERSRLVARTANNLGATLFYSGNTTEALPVMEYALEQWRALGLEDGSDSLTVMTNLASLLHQMGELDRAEPLYRELIERRQRRFGASGALGAAYLNYASLLAMRYRPEEAERHVRQGLEMIVRFEGEASVNYARALLVFGRVLTTVGDFARAEDFLDQAVTRFDNLLGTDHLFSKVAKMYRARLSVAMQAERGRDELQAVIDAMETMRPGADSHLAVAHCEMARLEIMRGQPRAGLDAAGRCRALRETSFSAESWLLAEVDALEAAARLQLGQDRAREQLTAARDRLAAVLGPGHPDLRWCDRLLDG